MSKKETYSLAKTLEETVLESVDKSVRELLECLTT
jgi:hypothetical protein